MSEIPDEMGFISLLVERHPRLFHGKHPRVMSDCPPGWQSLVDRFFADVDVMLDDEQARSFRVEQIKEKFAGLRIYWKLGKQKTTAVDVFANDGIIRLQTQPNQPTELFDQIAARVTLAEEEAAQTCQKCGSLGAERRSRGWLITLCAACAAPRPQD